MRIRKACFVLCLLTIGSCCKISYKWQPSESRYYDYSKQDLNTLIVIDYLQRRHPSCEDNDCFFNVGGDFISFNRCFEEYLGNVVKRTNYSFEDTLKISKSITVDGWGTISIFGTVNYDYRFAPMMLDKEEGEIYGQVYVTDTNNKEFYHNRFFAYTIVGDSLYFRGDIFSHDGSCWE